jgi:acetate kinase
MNPTALTVNAGSSSLKLALFQQATDGQPSHALDRLLSIGVDFEEGTISVRAPGEEPETVRPAGRLDTEAALAQAVSILARRQPGQPPSVIGHRVVHGGDRFADAVILDDATTAQVDALSALAPLHQPVALQLIRAMPRHYPVVAQVASFDTSFHQTMAPVARRFALPRALHDEGIKRYGFHGLSYRHIAAELRQHDPALAAGRVVAAHLGSGASLCALHDGVSIDTTMSFSTLDGIPMATRCGALDPGVLLHLLQQRKMQPDEVEDLLYHRSGLLGASGISPDTRDLLLSKEPAAQEALQMFYFQIARSVAALATSMGGLDGIVFTAGIGEHQPEVRAGVCAHLAWLGVRLDPDANSNSARQLDHADSRIAVRVIPADEERVIALDALRLRSIHG